jgi:hypothetical protein
MKQPMIIVSQTGNGDRDQHHSRAGLTETYRAVRKSEA